MFSVAQALLNARMSQKNTLAAQYALLAAIRGEHVVWVTRQRETSQQLVAGIVAPDRVEGRVFFYGDGSIEFGTWEELNGLE